jgi:hypothetical protein
MATEQENKMEETVDVLTNEEVISDADSQQQIFDYYNNPEKGGYYKYVPFKYPTEELPKPDFIKIEKSDIKKFLESGDKVDKELVDKFKIYSYLANRDELNFMGKPVKNNTNETTPHREAQVIYELRVENKKLLLKMEEYQHQNNKLLTKLTEQVQLMFNEYNRRIEPKPKQNWFKKLINKIFN